MPRLVGDHLGYKEALEIGNVLLFNEALHSRSGRACESRSDRELQMGSSLFPNAQQPLLRKASTAKAPFSARTD
jgi:hypothetical protein